MAMPAGRKQLLGHTELFALVMTSIAAVVLVDGSVGSPSLVKLTIESL